MERIKKTVKLYTTTGTTESGDHVIISDTGTSYNFKIFLSSKTIDLGYFDVLEQTGATGVTISNTPYTVTGESSSRLFEVRKYTKTGSTLNVLYFLSTGSTSDGLDESLTVTGTTYVYYLGGITYTDTVSNGNTTTTFSFESSGYSSPNFVNYSIYKDENKENIIDKPEVGSDVFVIRESIPVFENQYRLRNLQNVTELEYYAGGAHFTIKNNT